ncbi:MAG: hypothetical protein ACFFDI_25765 [Promethearchaeota archaeon]
MFKKINFSKIIGSFSSLTAGNLTNQTLCLVFSLLVTTQLASNSKELVDYFLFVNTVSFVIILTQSFRNMIARTVSKRIASLEKKITSEDEKQLKAEGQVKVEDQIKVEGQIETSLNLRTLSLSLFVIYIIVSMILVILWLTGFYPYLILYFVFLLLFLIPVFVLPITNGFLQGMQKYTIFGIGTAIDGISKLTSYIILFFAGVSAYYSSAIAFVIAPSLNMLFGLTMLTALFRKNIARIIESKTSNNGTQSFNRSLLPKIDVSIASVSLAILVNFDIFFVRHFFPSEIEAYGTIVIIAKPLIYLAKVSSEIFITTSGKQKQKALDYLTLGLFSLAVIVIIAAGKFLLEFLYPEIHYSYSLIIITVVYYLTTAALTVLFFKKLESSPGSKKLIFFSFLIPLSILALIIPVNLWSSLLICSSLAWIIYLLFEFSMRSKKQIEGIEGSHQLEEAE